jgi:hypothetical protein
MKSLSRADMHLIDRNDKRYRALQNRLAKEGKADILVENLNHETWMEL